MFLSESIKFSTLSIQNKRLFPTEPREGGDEGLKGPSCLVSSVAQVRQDS